MSRITIAFIPNSAGVHDVQVSITYPADSKIEKTDQSFSSGDLILKYEESNENDEPAGTYVDTISISAQEAADIDEVKVELKEKNGGKIRTSSGYPD